MNMDSKLVQNLLESMGRRLTIAEETISHDHIIVQELKTQESDLNESVNRALQTLLPKVEALLSKRENGISIRGPSIRSVTGPPFLAAAQCGDVEVLLKMLEEVTCAQQRNQRGESALHLAAGGDHERAVIVLVGAGAAVDSAGPHFRTPLHYASVGGHVGPVRRLVAAGAQMEARDANGDTPMLLAVRNYHTECVAALLSIGASPTARDKDGDTALIIAVKSSHRSVVDLMVRKNVPLDDADRDGNSALVHAAKIGAWDLVRLLCEKGASLKVHRGIENRPLLLASESGSVEAVDFLLRRGVLQSDELEDALARAKDASIMWVFEDALPGILRGASGQWAMRQAAQDGRLDTLLALLDAGVDINSKYEGDGGTALIFASGHGRAHCIKELIERGVLIDVKDKNGFSALHNAVIESEEECVHILLEAGADASVKTKNGKTLLDLAKSDNIRELLINQSFP